MRLRDDIHKDIRLQLRQAVYARYLLREDRFWCVWARENTVNDPSFNPRHKAARFEVVRASGLIGKRGRWTAHTQYGPIAAKSMAQSWTALRIHDGFREDTVFAEPPAKHPDPWQDRAPDVLDAVWDLL